MKMISTIELFDMYRWLLATVCTIYVIICTYKSLMGWLHYFNSSRETAVLGRYTAVLLLRLRFKRFRWEICQILILTVIFGYIVYYHYTLGNTS